MLKRYKMQKNKSKERKGLLTTKRIKRNHAASHSVGEIFRRTAHVLADLLTTYW